MKLSSREILYLSALAGANELIGIPDGFYGMDTVEIKQEILKIQTNLEDKGYAQTDFNGNFELSSEVKQAIETCAFCEKYISAEIARAESGVAKMKFYLRKGYIVKAEEKAARYDLTLVAPESIYQTILDFVDWDTQSCDNVGDRVLIPQTLLAQVKNASAEDFTETPGEENLQKAGCSNTQAKIILEGLSRKSNFISILVLDLASSENKTVSIMAVNSKSGSLELVATQVNENEAVELRAMDYNAFKNKLGEALALVGVADGGDEFV